MKPEEEKEIKNWDVITVSILVISILVIIFAFFSPMIFTSSSSSERFDFSDTGPIGDTIGGLLNPFIALGGVLLTFLAFYMQIKANQIQISQFSLGLKKEKANRLELEKRDYFNKLSLLKIDLGAIKIDIESKAANIKNYYESLRDFPLHTHFLIRTPSQKYTRILETDRLSIFNGFSAFLNHRERWINDFSNLYNILEFLPESFSDIYRKYDYHTKDLHERKLKIREGLIRLMNDLSRIIEEYRQLHNQETYLSFPASALANETIVRYYAIIEQDVDNKKETDLDEVNENVFQYFLTEAMELRENEHFFDNRFVPIIEQVSGLRKQMFFIKQTAQEFASSIERQYENLMVDKENAPSHFTKISEIHNFLEIELEKIKIED